MPGTIHWEASSLTLKFAITQPPPGDGQPVVTKVTAGAMTPAIFTVVSQGQPKPDMFAPGRDVIVEGLVTPNNMIEARQVLTSCPSKYSPKQNQG
jgi:hypothetical protein